MEYYGVLLRKNSLQMQTNNTSLKMC